MTTANDKPAASDFDKLIDEISGAATVIKALPAKAAAKGGKDGDGKIVAAAADGKDPAEDDADADADADGEAGGAEIGKSFDVTFADGTKGTALDGTALFKALSERAERAEGAVSNIWSVVKSLQAEVTALRTAAKPRKSLITVNEKPAASEVSKAGGDGISPQIFLAKALEAQAAGRVSGLELTKAENQINKGIQPDADFVRRVIGS